MALKKTRFKPPVYVNGKATYPDTHHFETSGDQVKIDDAGEYFTAEDTEGVLQEVGIHIADKNNPHEVTAAKAGALSTTDAGDRTYTEQNYIADAEPLTTSIDKLDMQLKDTADLVSTNVGDLETLTTTDKSSLVNATNEVKNLVDTNTQFTDVDNVVYSWRFIKSAEGHMQLEYTEVI